MTSQSAAAGYVNTGWRAVNLAVCAVAALNVVVNRNGEAVFDFAIHALEAYQPDNIVVRNGILPLLNGTRLFQILTTSPTAVTPSYAVVPELVIHIGNIFTKINLRKNEQIGTGYPAP